MADKTNNNADCQWFTEWLCEDCDPSICANYMPPKIKNTQMAIVFDEK